MTKYVRAGDVLRPEDFAQNPGAKLIDNAWVSYVPGELYDWMIPVHSRMPARQYDCNLRKIDGLKLEKYIFRVFRKNFTAKMRRCQGISKTTQKQCGRSVTIGSTSRCKLHLYGDLRFQGARKKVSKEDEVKRIAAVSKAKMRHGKKSKAFLEKHAVDRSRLLMLEDVARLVVDIDTPRTSSKPKYYKKISTLEEAAAFIDGLELQAIDENKSA